MRDCIILLALIEHQVGEKITTFRLFHSNSRRTSLAIVCTGNVGCVH
jgi:hypothetical protein